MKILINWLKKQLGFVSISPYEKRYINDANIHTSLYMSFIVFVLELWMIIRYVVKRPGLTFLEYFEGESNYLILLCAALLLIIFSVRYIRELESFSPGKVIALGIVLLDICMISRYLYSNLGSLGPLQILWGIKYHIILLALCAVYIEYEFAAIFEGARADLFGQTMIVLFSIISIGFGIQTSIYDITWGRQIMCFLAMVMFAACMLVWRPFVSIVILGGSFLYFYYHWLPTLIELDKSEGKVLEGDTINYFVLWIVLVMVSFSIYHQRLKEASKDEGLLNVNSRLNKVAVEDELTGIHNMIYFNQEAVYVLMDESNDLDDMIFLFMNIENFKTYNDQIGYQAGNAYLKKFANIVKDTFGKEPTARLSDDHFVVLAKASTVQEKINIIRESMHEDAEGVYLELKVGGYRPVARDLDPRIAIDYARYACGLTKNRFNVNFVEYDKDIDSKFHKNQYIVNNIDNAILNGYIQPYYQPVVWAGSRELCGVEALARWVDPTYGFLSPADFIPVLEDNRQIHKLDEHIIKQVCKDCREALNNRESFVPVSINFSRLDFELMDVPAVLEKYTHEYGVPKEYLHIEITESALNADDEMMDSVIKKLQEDGYSIWLDDFGSGYSSLNLLKDYHFDMMKIDMEFLSNFGANKESAIILNTVIKLADELGMMSLTEGVETEEIADFLSKAGCGRLQGYYFGKPMPKHDFREKIDSGEFVISDHF